MLAQYSSGASLIEHRGLQRKSGALALLVLILAVAALRPNPAAAQSQNPIPVLAYYYIWFDPGSWERAKTDYPQLGRYSSDDREVMQQHVRWAKEAGLTGFIVSWKSTEVLNRRLDLLVEVAREEDFKLVIIYQGLTFERDPLPIDRIAMDLDHFIERYGADPVFRLFERPAIIWSGSWEYTPEDIARVAESRRDRLLILASEKNLQAYHRLAGLVDGNAYYWSSVNPDTFPAYDEKLAELGAAIHANGGLWIAPAAPGFDARLVGGTRVVERKDGETLQRQMQAALESAPDAVGLISWNEFSENTHIEPSTRLGTRYLAVLAGLLGGTAPAPLQFASDEPLLSEPFAPADELGAGRIYSLLALAGLVVTSFVVILFRGTGRG